MASWMVHLRISDMLLDAVPNLSETEFVVGNIAPDSGVPNDDWSVYTPAKSVSHFKDRDTSGKSYINIEKYVESYFNEEKRKRYTNKQFSFYLGYLVHLLTDVLWIENVMLRLANKYSDDYAADSTSTIWRWKKDFYDLDAKFIKENPDLRAYKIFSQAICFDNLYMKEFPRDAFENRREYITAFYSTERCDLDRNYQYFKEDEMNEFVISAAGQIKIEVAQYLKC